MWPRQNEPPSEQLEFDAGLSRELGTRTTVEQALAATRQDLLQTEAALRDATAQHAKEMTSASNELSEQHTQYTTRLDQASAAHAALEQRLADADQRHASALRDAATQFTEQQRKYETHLAEITTARVIVSAQLHDTETATLLRTRQESDANAIALCRATQPARIRACSGLRGPTGAGRATRRYRNRASGTRSAGSAPSERRRYGSQRSAGRSSTPSWPGKSRRATSSSVILAETRVAADETRQALLGESAGLTTRCENSRRASLKSSLADAGRLRRQTGRRE